MIFYQMRMKMACSVGNLIYIDFENIDKPLVEKSEFDMEKYGGIQVV